MRLHHRVAVTAAVVASAAMGGCATLRQQDNVPPHPITITVNNNLSLPSDLTVYAVSTYGGPRILGSAVPARTTSFQLTPRSFSEPYRLLARTAMGGRIWSQQYTVRDTRTGEIIWTLVPNILAFRDVPDTTATASSTP